MAIKDLIKKPADAVRSKATLLRSIVRDNSAVAMVEFAFTAPIVLGLGMMGTETAYFTITHMQMSQIAMQVADNASRVGETDVLTERKIYESDINGTFVGAEKLGDRYSIYERGRIVVSSLQHNGDDGQMIAWQRCRGAKQAASKYGVEGVGADNNSFVGMGNPSKPITATSGTAVMFVEVFYTYNSLTPFELFEGRELEYTAAFNVRDNRDLTQIYNTDGDPVASCSVYSADRPV